MDLRFMRIALSEARKGLGRTSPNPAVGAVLVKDRKVIAKGFHRKAGGPHAEIVALNQLQDIALARGATLYVTLEPCSSRGRTPPCTEAIIKAGIRRVVIGAIDPNPQHRGGGIEKLRSAGVEVDVGVLTERCTDLNVGFNRWIQTKTPWVIAKVGQSLDGRLTRPPGESQWLTNPYSRRIVQHLRATTDAILVGAETVRVDNPSLTVRTMLVDQQPWRIVVTRSGRLPEDAQIFKMNQDQRTLVFQNKSWTEILTELGAMGVTRLLVEGGGNIMGQLFDEDRIDEFWSFIAPMLVGGPKMSMQGSSAVLDCVDKHFQKVRYIRLKDDVLAIGKVTRFGCTEGAP
jgi:diaminohydroxyphosphoribosylaminopyrimidine deaminase / 5-amino-6-(5-phosphoribosylamino)uracil reductase